MNNVVLAKDIVKRGYFSSYSEFYLVLAMSKAFKEKGYILNMDNMKIDVDSIPQEYIKYYKKLLNEGYLNLSMYEKKDVLVESKVDINTEYFSKVNLLKDNGDTLDWTIDFALSSYGSHAQEFLDLMSLGGSLVHLVAYHLVNVLLGSETRKMIIHFDSYKAKSTFLYVNIYSCLQTMSWVRDYVDLDIDFDDFEVDLDYSIFCNNGKVAGHFKQHTISEKLSLLNKFGMVEGSVLVLWKREGMCENNVFGYVTDASVIRLDEIGDDFLGVTKIAINKTKEEVQQGYNDIDESIRHLFIDMLDKKPHLSSTELDIVSLGVDNYFYDEEMYLTTIYENEEVQKMVTIDGKVENVKMKEVDAIYWLLCQYEIEFDKELFKKMYFHGNEPLWDKYN